MFGNRAQYTWGIDGEILWLKDHGTECRSLSNDLENCLVEVAGQFPEGKKLTDFKIIYRDSEKEWDGICITQIGDDLGLKISIDWLKYSAERGRPYWTDYVKINFFPIREMSYESAKQSILANERYKHFDDSLGV